MSQAQWLKAGGAVSCANTPGQQDTCWCLTLLYLSSPGHVLGEALPFPPQIHIPQAGLAAPVSLGMLLALCYAGLTKKLLMELFSTGAKAHNTFLAVPCGISSGELCSGAAGHWHGLHWSLEPHWGGDALPRASQLLNQ